MQFAIYQKLVAVRIGETQLRYTIQKQQLKNKRNNVFQFQMNVTAYNYKFSCTEQETTA